jgi:hypothetical protein
MLRKRTVFPQVKLVGVSRNPKSDEGWYGGMGPCFTRTMSGKEGVANLGTEHCRKAASGM